MSSLPIGSEHGFEGSEEWSQQGMRNGEPSTGVVRGDAAARSCEREKQGNTGLEEMREVKQMSSLGMRRGRSAVERHWSCSWWSQTSSLGRQRYRCEKGARASTGFESAVVEPHHPPATSACEKERSGSEQVVQCSGERANVITWSAAISACGRGVTLIV